MPTVAELVRWDGPLGLDVCAGGSGLAREISRIVRGSTERLDIPLQSGDVVLVSGAEWQRAVAALDGAGRLQVAAVIVSAPAHDASPRAQRWSTPVLLLSEPRLEQALPVLTEWLDQCAAHEERQAIELRQLFDDVSPAGDLRLITERLVQTTGKPVFVHDAQGNVELACQPAARRPGQGDFETLVRTAAETIGRRGSRGNFPVIGLAYDELPALDAALISLVTAGASPGLPTQYISVLGRAADFTHRDRAALASVPEAQREPPSVIEADAATWGRHLLELLLGGRVHQAQAVASSHGHDLDRPHIGVAFGSVGSVTGVPEVFTRGTPTEQPLVLADQGHVVCLVPAEHGLTDPHQRAGLVRQWHAQVCAAGGPVSLGYTALHTCAAGARAALVEACHALAAGDRVHGAGHCSSYAELGVQDFLSSGHQPRRLQELRERVLGPILSADRSARNELAETLSTHLDTGCRTVQTADVLGVHRNSVLYRLQRISELIHVDLEDPDTRLLLQLALRTAAASAPTLVHPNGLDHSRLEVVWSDDLALHLQH